MEKLDMNIKSAVIWQLEHMVRNLTNGKLSNSFQAEIDKIFEKCKVEDYTRYLVRILFREIDFQNSRQKETAKLNLLRPYLVKYLQSPYFLTQYIYEFFDDVNEVLEKSADMLKHLRLKISEQVLFMLGVYTYCMSEHATKFTNAQLIKLRGKSLKDKLKEWFEYEKDGELPSYAVFALLHIFKTEVEMKEDPNFLENLKEYLIQQNLKVMREPSMHAVKMKNIYECNRTSPLYKYESETKNSSDFKLVEKCSNTWQVLEPWQVLVDMGPATSHFELELLVDVLKDFNKTSMRGLTHTLIALSNNFVAEDNQKNLETITMKCNMKGDMTYMNEDPNEYPKSQLQWNIENLVNAIKEVYPAREWAVEPIKFLDVDIDAREEYYFKSQDAFDVFMSIWNQLKPQNKPFPVDAWIEKVWKNKRAQVTCLDYVINYSYNNNDIQFEKAKRRQELINNLQGAKPAAASYLRIWKCIDLVQTLVVLSESDQYFRVRSLFDGPIKVMPEYLLLTLTKIKTKSGKFLVENLYSHLLPPFLTGHTNSIPVLSEVWTADSKLLINAMSELYKKNPKNMNLSRVLDISQSIKNSLLEIITTTKDYEFSLPLGMLGAKRDFLHFENWIVMLIKSEGDPFVRCLLKYIDTNLVQPAEE